MIGALLARLGARRSRASPPLPRAWRSRLSEPHRHDHRALSGGRTDRHRPRARSRTSLSKQLKQNFIVENVTGGGTIIATNKVAKSTPDGYTLLLHNLQISANVTLYKNLPFDTEKDLTPVMLHQQQSAGAGRPQGRSSRTTAPNCSR